MKRIALVAALSMVPGLLAGPLGATPPNAIHAHYESDRGELHVTAEHPVSDRKEHFVREVVVAKNGRQVAELSFDFQTSKRNQTMPPFRIVASPGDRLTITARCNESGEETITLVVPGPDLVKG